MRQLFLISPGNSRKLSRKKQWVNLFFWNWVFFDSIRKYY